jgi:methylglutaconyl-CoA hydratase
MAGYSYAENLADASALATMLSTLNRVSKPTVARVHGAAYGGGVGLVACCDVAIGTPQAAFSLSEARLGLIPAAISPYVIEAIGARAARRYFLSAEGFSAEEALRLGLLHEVVAESELDAAVDRAIAALLDAGPRAQSAAKELIRAVAHRPIDERVIGDTAERIARVRATPEGKEGVAAFLARRKPAWQPRES